MTIGEGRYAKVKLAYNISEKKYVAIKVARKSSDIYHLELLYKEIQTLVDLKNTNKRNTVSIMDFNFCGKLKKNNGKKTQLAYYVMNYVEYGELFR